MNAFTLIVGFFIAALAATAAIMKFHRGLLPKWQVIGITLAGLLIIGAGLTDIVLIDHRDAGARAREHLDATAKHVADLKQRIEANVAAMQAALAEPQTSHEPSMVERDQAWRDRVATLANETGTLVKERDQLSKEINAIESDADAAASADRLSQSRFSILLEAALILYFAIAWSALALNVRKRRAEMRSEWIHQHGLDPTFASDRVKQLAASGAKIAAIVAYRLETGANLREAKEAVEALSSDKAIAG
jgi:hypothetical protein